MTRHHWRGGGRFIVFVFLRRMNEPWSEGEGIGGHVEVLHMILSAKNFCPSSSKVSAFTDVVSHTHTHRSWVTAPLIGYFKRRSLAIGPLQRGLPEEKEKEKKPWSEPKVTWLTDGWHRTKLGSQTHTVRTTNTFTRLADVVKEFIVSHSSTLLLLSKNLNNIL